MFLCNTGLSSFFHSSPKDMCIYFRDRKGEKEKH